MNNGNIGPVYGVELIDTLPLDGCMLQQLPSRRDLEDVLDRNTRVVAGYEVLLEHYRRAMSVIEYLDNPEVLCKIPQPHRMELSLRLHSYGHDDDCDCQECDERYGEDRS